MKGAPGSLDAKLLLQGVATAIAQPFVQSAKLDLPKDIGPTLDVDLRAKTAAAMSTIQTTRTGHGPSASRIVVEFGWLGPVYA